MINYEMLENACSCFARSERPFLLKMTDFMRANQPYKGLKILHNIHLTLSTVCKIIPLLYSNANLTVTITKNLKSDPQVEKILKNAGVNFIKPERLENNFDIVLDCCASVIDFIEPKIGLIELTQTGSVKCKNLRLNYPVISIDDSVLKKLETFYGTGDGFLRAFLELTKENIDNKKFIIFGYGKVGQGVAKAVAKFTNNIFVLEKDPFKVNLARSHGLSAFTIFEKTKKIKQLIGNAFCVITATGEEGVISRHFDKEHFSSCKYLANVGSDDEFGNKFSNNEVLFNKKPINFSLIEPTKMRFLDPVFYAHNLGIDLLLSQSFSNGVNVLPKDIDLNILNRWYQFHNYDPSEIHQLQNHTLMSNQVNSSGWISYKSYLNVNANFKDLVASV